MYEFNRNDVDAILRNANLNILKAEIHCVTSKNLMFSDIIKKRMKEKNSFLSKIKYGIYMLLSLIPFNILKPLINTIRGYDYYVLCQNSH